MARFYPIGGSGVGVSSSEVSATSDTVLSGRTYVGADTNDDIGTGTMPDNSTTTSNGTVPGVSSEYPTIPVRESPNLIFLTDTNGTDRIVMDPVKGYYPGGGTSYISRPASDFGNAQVNQVLAGSTFTSQYGLRLPGIIQTVAGGSITPAPWQTSFSTAGRYVTGDITVPPFTMPAANIIKKGAVVNIYGQTVTGTFEGYINTGYDIFFDGNSSGSKYGGVYTDYVTVNATNISIKTNAGQDSAKGMVVRSPVPFTGYSQLIVRYQCTNTLTIAITVEGSTDHSSWELSTTTKRVVGDNTYEVILDISTISRAPMIFIGTKDYYSTYSFNVYRILLRRSV